MCKTPRQIHTGLTLFIFSSTLYTLIKRMPNGSFYCSQVVIIVLKLLPLYSNWFHCAKIVLCSDNKTLEIYNHKYVPKVDDMAEETYKWVKSKASCKLNTIKGIMFGGISSRFWMLRKHINSIPLENLRLNKVPFYSWECITLQLEERDVDLVI